MAVTLTQMSKDIARQRASTVPHNMRSYNPSEVIPMPMPMPEQYHYSTSAARNYDHGPYKFFQSTPITYPPRTPQRSRMDPSYQISIPSAVPQSPSFHDSPLVFNQHSSSYHHSPPGFNQHPPPLPAKEPIHDSSSDRSSPQLSTHSSSGWSSGSFSRSSIEPDPLPPHSNPQVLTESQSHAYSNSQRIPALRVGRDEVWNSQTGFAEYRIARQDGKIMPTFMSTKPRLNIIKTSSGLSMGSIRFHTISSNKIELVVNGRETSISHTSFVRNRWGFQSTTCPTNTETWYWKKDRETGGAMLEDAKWSGRVLARLKGDLLTFEKARLSHESYEEIVISAIAMAEAARRQKRKSDIVDIASAIGDFTSSDGKHVMEGGVGLVWNDFESKKYALNGGVCTTSNPPDSVRYRS